MRDVRPLVTVAQSVEIQTWAFRQLGLGLAWNSSNKWIDARFADIPLPTVGKVMTGGIEPDWLGIKFAGARNDSQRRVEVQLLTLFRAGSLQPVAVMEASYLGIMRTGAMAAVGTSNVARNDALTLGILGSGATARSALLAHSVLPRRFRKVYVHSRSRASAERFAREMHEQSGLEVDAVNSAEDVVRSSDVLVTATAAEAPAFKAEWVLPGTHINAIGSRREIDPALFEVARVIVDDPEIALTDGKTATAMKSGQVHRSIETTSLGDVLAGRADGRRSDDEITVLDSSGLAVQDIAMGLHVLEAAIERNVGLTYDLFSANHRSL
jgi:ornithine cyclodeaminase/alanine dehydrogenase-like protein (mu-crystallin family)